MTQYIIIGGIALVVLFAAVYIKMTIDEKKGANSEEKQKIQEIVKTAQHLADNDPGSFIILKSNMEILKARCDMQKLKEERPVA